MCHVAGMGKLPRSEIGRDSLLSLRMKFALSYFPRKSQVPFGRENLCCGILHSYCLANANHFQTVAERKRQRVTRYSDVSGPPI